MATLLRPLRLTGLAVLLCLAIVSLAGCGSDDDELAPELSDPNETAEELVNRYMSMLASKDVQGLDDFLSEGFMRQGAEGRFASKDDYLNNLPQISQYTISDVRANQEGNALVVSWNFKVTETIGVPLGTAPTPRLATFVWQDGEWKLLSHANFNPPASQ
jgi:hypothetical protein